MLRPIKLHRWALCLALACTFILAACSDLYLDRRETVSFGAGNAVAAATAVQAYDPWPPASANRDIRSNGPRTAGAIERYRTGKIIPPQGLGTSSAGYSPISITAQGGAGSGGGSGTPGSSGSGN
jgi:hypothetical protein